MTNTPHQRLAGELLDQPLADYIGGKRAAGLSWRAIARDLDRDTDGKVSVSDETVRKWAHTESAS